MVWDNLAASSAEVGVLFTTFVLITGPLWARPVWGHWWVWDPRLTTTLILWFLYVGYLVLRQAIPGYRGAMEPDRERSGRRAEHQGAGKQEPGS